MKKILKVFINGKLVGSISDLEVDMPWFSARFVSSSAFAEFEPLFVRLDQAYGEKHHDIVNQLNDEINRLRIAVQDENGRLVFSTEPRDMPAQRIRTIRILGNEMVWRPAS
jgi:hypothetical protein